MNTKEAVLAVLSRHSISKYRLAKTIGVQPIMIDRYLTGTRMGVKPCREFEREYLIEIDDVYDPSIKYREDEDE